MSNVDKNAEIILVNPTASGGTINLPLTSTLPYRTLTIKHIGSTSLNGITVATQGPDTFEDGTTSYVITRITTFATFYANTSANKWVLVGGTNTFTQTISSLIVNTINGQAYLPISPANLVSTSLLDTTFQSTVRGLATSGYISTSQLVSTTIGLVDHLELQSTFVGLGTSGYISSSQLLSTTIGLVDQPELQSTIAGLGTSGYISSSQLLSTTIGLVDQPELQSTIVGLGTSGYISSSQLLSTTIGLVDQPELQSTIVGLGTSGYISSSQLVSTTIGLVDQPELQSTIVGLGTSGYISSSQLLSTTIGLVDQPELQSTIAGLGTSGYISSSQLLSTTIGLVDQPELQSTIAGLGTSGYISSSQLQSTVRGLGTTGYLSSATGLISTATLDFTLQSTVRGLGTTGYLSSATGLISTATLDFTLQSTVRGLGTSGYISSATGLISTATLDFTLQSTVRGLGTTGYLSSATGLISTATLDFTLQSTVRGLATTGYISTSQLVSTTIGLVDHLELQSTFVGLGTVGYISTSQLVSTTIGLVDHLELQSTFIGLGTVGYISTSQLVSTTIGLVDHLELQSTFVGLGTVGYISTSQLVSTTIGLVDHLELQSTFIGLGTVGYISSTQLQSTLRGLGTIGYISSVTAATTPAFLSTNAFFTSSLVASTISVTNTFFTNALIARSSATNAFFTSSLVASTMSVTNTLFTNALFARSTNLSSVYISSLTAVNGYISSLITDSITIGDGNGWIDFGAARAVIFSSVQTNTGSLYATTAFIGNTSTLNQIRYWGLFGNYNNTILAEVSTGSAVGAQEFLVFKGSSTSDRIRFQTTGDIRFEPQVAAREFSTATALAVPTLILQSNLVGINNAAPTTTLDVTGTIRGQIVSTLALNLSSINGVVYSVASFSNLVSTPFLDTTLRSTIGNLGQVYLSSAATLVSTPFLDTTLVSTINGLGTLNYLSSATLQSTVLGFNANFTTSSLTVSSISFGNTFGFLNLGDVQTDTLSSVRIFTSTINVDGSLFMYDKQLLNYGDLTLSNQSLYINGTVVGGGGGGITAGNLTSTVEGLGTVNYISGPTIIASTIIAQDILGAFNTFSSTLKLLGETDLYEDFPAWNSSNQILGSDPDPAPLRLDIFGSARILKNLYVGSTTTVLTTAGVQAEQLSTFHTATSSMTLSDKGPLFASTNTVTSITDVFLNDSYVAQRIPVIPLVISTITTNMMLQPEFLGMHFVLINSDSNFNPPVLVRADATFVANVPDGWYCYLKQTPDSNYPFNSIEAETDLSNAFVPTTEAGMSNYQAPMKFIVSGGLKIPY